MTINHSTRIQLASGQSSSALGKETIVLNYDQGSYYELNEIGGFIWALLQTNKVMAVEEIQEKILNEFDVQEDVCQKELKIFLENMLLERLIETTA
ncbi:PqqD family protein [Spirosoma jeollabukense]